MTHRVSRVNLHRQSTVVALDCELLLTRCPDQDRRMLGIEVPYTKYLFYTGNGSKQCSMKGKSSTTTENRGWLPV
jgi:hypothetical protein